MGEGGKEVQKRWGQPCGGGVGFGCGGFVVGGGQTPVGLTIQGSVSDVIKEPNLETFLDIRKKGWCLLSHGRRQKTLPHWQYRGAMRKPFIKT